MKDIEDYLSGIIRDMQDEIDLLEHQNKRYREALRKIIKEGENGEYSHYTAQRALEVNNE